MKTFFIKTFGCQYNVWDATRLSFLLKSVGYEEVSDNKQADVVFILNCSVRKTGVDRALGWAKNLVGKKVITCGCVLNSDKKRFIEKGSLLWDGKNLVELAKLLGLNAKTESLKRYLSKGQKFSNYIPIITGCNNFCSYCAVPYTRGREFSRPIDLVLDDIKQIVEAGQKEIWLLGQNVNSYEFGFAKLLKEISKIEGNFKIFFTSNHPKDMTDEIIQEIANNEKVAKAIHLPLQSGSDKILKAMNRPYTRKQYLELVKKITERIPGLKLTTDVIVGFPGETEDDFNQTVEIFERIRFYQAYINKYSPREGTAAFKLGDPIPWSEKQRRWRILNELVNKPSSSNQ